MRIIAGAKRGMKLLGPPPLLRFAKQSGGGSRPITDRVKESLFNVLWNYGFPEDKIVADLFCGVGSLGLETLSRGAEFVAFVEKDPRIIATLKKNIGKAGFAGGSKVIKADAFKIGAPANERKYDLIFVDPPYSASQDTKAGSSLAKLLVLLNERLSQNGIVVVRTEKQIELAERYGLLEVIERRQWGTMAVAILHRRNG
jgi:16S rRNA (guanine966-N2)-methyltransferase